jgi:hypothetical protein
MLVLACSCMQSTLTYALLDEFYLAVVRLAAAGGLMR